MVTANVDVERQRLKIIRSITDKPIPTEEKQIVRCSMNFLIN